MTDCDIYKLIFKPILLVFSTLSIHILAFSVL